MKNKILLFFVFILIIDFVYPQQLNRFSVEGDLDYFHSFQSSTLKSNNFKFGYSIRFSDYINNFKVSFGVGYTAHSFVLKNSDIGSVIESTDYDAIRIYYPLILSYQIIDKKVSSYASFGPVLNSLLQCDKSVNYINGSQFITKNLSVDKRIGVSLYTDFNVSLLLNTRFKLHLTPFAQFNLLQDHTSGQLGYQEFLDEKPYVGLKFGLEYFIK